MGRILFLCCWLFCTSLYAQDGVWQWHVDVPNGSNAKGVPKAYLWVHPECRRLRGLVLAQHNMEEISILEDRNFREAMARLGFGIVWFNPMFDVGFNFTQGAGEQLPGSLHALAIKSGYSEIDTLPFLAIGHSAAASWPYYLAVWCPERTLCAISVSGQWPYFRDPRWAPDIWGNRTHNYIPALETMGEYESANSWSAEGLKERSEHSLLPMSMLACPAEGHFAATPEKIAYIIGYIQKAVQYRMPAGKLPLQKIDPESTGWLADKWRINQEPHAQAAPVSEYKGDKMEAFWFFDEEHALATERYQSRFRNQKAPLLGVRMDGKLIPQRNTHLQVQLPFRPRGTEMSIPLAPVFLDTVPGESPRPATWSGLSAGSTVSHPDDTKGLFLEKICGPFRVAAGPEFQVSFNRLCFQSSEERWESAFVIRYAGDKAYKAAVQQGQLFIPAQLTEGEPQRITFPEIPNVGRSKKRIRLKATSSAGLKVHYYVVSGPAQVHGNLLHFTPIPAGAKFPVEVTIVAWQYGRMDEPRIQSAPQVVRSFCIE